MIITGHSGSDGTRENSMEFVERMLEGGIRYIEVDVRKTLHNQLYLSHDAQDFYEKPVYLEEVFHYLSTYNRNAWVNCDLKEQNLEQLVLALARTFGLEKQIVFSGTVNLNRLTRSEVEEQTYYNVENILPNVYKFQRKVKDLSAEIVSFCKEKQVKIINVHYLLCTEAFLEEMKSNHILVSAWTVDDIWTVEKLKNAGIYNVTSRNALTISKELVKRGEKV